MLREEEEDDDRRSASAGGSGKDDAEAEEADDMGLDKAGPKPASFWVSPGRSMAWTGTQRRASVRASFRSQAPSPSAPPPLVAPLRTQTQRIETPVIVCVCVRSRRISTV